MGKANKSGVSGGVKGGKPGKGGGGGGKPFTHGKGSKGKNAGKLFIPRDERLDLDGSENVASAIHVELPEGGGKKGEGKGKKNIAKDYQGELDGLAEADPEFHAFLRDNDPSMLEFARDEDSDDEDIDDDVASDDDDEEEEEEGDDDDNEGAMEGSDDDDDGIAMGSGMKRGAKDKAAVTVTPELVDTLIRDAKKGSLASLKSLLTAFRSACIPSSDTDKAAKSREYVLASPEIYQVVMTQVMAHSHEAIYSMLGLAPNARPSNAQLKALPKHAKWKKLQMQVLGFFKSILHVLASLADSNLNAEISVFLLSHLEPYIFLLAPLPRLVKGTLKILLGIWSQDANTEEDSFNARGYAFLRIRQITMTLPGTAMDECMRCIYLSFARNCRNYSEQNASTILFMIESITEVYSIDAAMAYQHAFLFVRQLALHLRAAMIKKSAEKSKELVGWQFVNCLRLWTHVMCAMPGDDRLGQLVYPLTQIIQGVLLAATSSVALPVRFHLVEFLQRLAAHSQLFIPTFRVALEVLEVPELQAKPSGSTDAPPVFDYMTRLAKGSLSKSTVRDVVVEHVCLALRREAEIYRFHVGYPEYAFLTIRRLKVFVKKCKNSRWRDMVRTVLGTVEKYTVSIKAGRTASNLNPMEITTFEPMLPAGEKAAAARLMKLLKASSAAAQATASGSEVVMATQKLANEKVAMPAKKTKSAKKGKGAKSDDGSDGEDEDEDEESGAEMEDDEDEGDDDDDDDEGSDDGEDKVSSFQDWSDDDE